MDRKARIVQKDFEIANAHLAIKTQPIDFSNGRFVLSEILKP